MVRTAPSVSEVWRRLDDVPDPEIPVISVVELGIVRNVSENDGQLVVTITPTYSGCPATSVISLEIDKALRDKGVEAFEIKSQISPAWTTDWISDVGREKLESYGIAPPSPAGGPERCPRCGDSNLEKISQFGSTPCKAQWRCKSCLEPFDYFKCI